MMDGSGRWASRIRASLVGSGLVIFVTCGVLGAAFAACGDKAPLGQIVLHVDTDAIVPEPGESGTPADATRLSPLVDRARFEVLVDGQPAAGTTRDFVVDAELLSDRRLSFGVVPRVGATNVSARVTLFRDDRVFDGIEPGIALRTIVALPPVPDEGVVDVSIVLHADDFGAEMGPVAPAPGTIAASVVDTWHGGHRTLCTAPARAGEACVAGGSFFFGNPQFRGRTPSNDIYQERLVSISPFFLDAAEVTVGAFRAVFASLTGALEPTVRNTGAPASDPAPFCTWTKAPVADVGGGSSEGVPLNCVALETAEAYCKAVGKELPTEAQFEFVTSGLGDEWAFPWGNDEPDCVASVWGRGGIGFVSDSPQNCREPDTTGGVAFPSTGQSDTLGSNVLRNAGGPNVLDLGGNLSEWMRDVWARQDEGVWNTLRPMQDPINTQPSPADGAARTVRGGNWELSALTTRAGFRLLRTTATTAASAAPDVGTGFRCARAGNLP